jgi:hypothetical protein
MTGQLGDDGIFYADELLLKCPPSMKKQLVNRQDKKSLVLSNTILTSHHFALYWSHNL